MPASLTGPPPPWRTLMPNLVTGDDATCCTSLFCDTGGGGGEILEEAGTFSGQALLLSYPYPTGWA